MHFACLPVIIGVLSCGWEGGSIELTLDLPLDARGRPSLAPDLALRQKLYLEMSAVGATSARALGEFASLLPVEKKKVAFVSLQAHNQKPSVSVFPFFLPSVLLWQRQQAQVHFCACGGTVDVAH